MRWSGQAVIANRQQSSTLCTIPAIPKNEAIKKGRELPTSSASSRGEHFVISLLFFFKSAIYYMGLIGRL